LKIQCGKRIHSIFPLCVTTKKFTGIFVSYQVSKVVCNRHQNICALTDFKNFITADSILMTLLIENRNLLKSFREGDAATLAIVYQTYSSPVLSLLQRGFTDNYKGTFIGGVSDINMRLDLLQDIFLKAFSRNARESYDGIRPYRAFLVTIARNRMIDYWRAQARDPIAAVHGHSQEYHDALLDNIHQTEKETGTDEEDHIYWKQCLEASDEFVTTQNEQTRRFISLRFREELPLLEVARQLNISRWRARSLEKKIQQNLEKHLRRKGLLQQ
jgi:RNA polymerase sigma factor (sigma-70 family)